MRLPNSYVQLRTALLQFNQIVYYFLLYALSMPKIKMLLYGRREAAARGLHKCAVPVICASLKYAPSDGDRAPLGARSRRPSLSLSLPSEHLEVRNVSNLSKYSDTRKNVFSFDFFCHNLKTLVSSELSLFCFICIC